MHKGFLKIAFVLAMIAVAMGAFGAHALRDMVSQRVLVTFETAVRYQFYHVFALLITAILYKEYGNKWLLAAGWFFITGIILFSGSLYMMSFVQAAVQPGYKWLGPVTPAGGMAFITGWLMLFIAVLKKR